MFYCFTLHLSYINVIFFKSKSPTVAEILVSHIQIPARRDKSATANVTCQKDRSCPDDISSKGIILCVNFREVVNTVRLVYIATSCTWMLRHSARCCFIGETKCSGLAGWLVGCNTRPGSRAHCQLQFSCNLHYSYEYSVIRYRTLVCRIR